MKCNSRRRKSGKLCGLSEVEGFRFSNLYYDVQFFCIEAALLALLSMTPDCRHSLKSFTVSTAFSFSITILSKLQSLRREMIYESAYLENDVVAESSDKDIREVFFFVRSGTIQSPECPWFTLDVCFFLSIC